MTYIRIHLSQVHGDESARGLQYLNNLGTLTPTRHWRACRGCISKSVLFLSKVAGSQGVIESPMWDPICLDVFRLKPVIKQAKNQIHDDAHASHHRDYMSKLSLTSLETLQCMGTKEVASLY